MVRRNRSGRRGSGGTPTIPQASTTTSISIVSSNPYFTPASTPGYQAIIDADQVIHPISIAAGMAPNPQQLLNENLRNTVQDLFSIQSNVHGYQGPATQRALTANFTTLHSNLQQIHASAHPFASRPIPPEVIEYIDDGRNPDIYTREFVELTQKGNRYLKSKAAAYAQFRDTLAQQTIEAWPEMREAVERVLDGRGAGVDGMQGMTPGGNNTRLKPKSDVGAEQGTVNSEDNNPESSVQATANSQGTSSTLPGLG